MHNSEIVHFMFVVFEELCTGQIGVIVVLNGHLLCGENYFPKL
jgi:hypothetical protein